jgi:hypothetical protein
MSNESSPHLSYEDAASTVTAGNFREKLQALSPYLNNFQYLSKWRRIAIRNEYDQLKRLIDVPPDTLLTHSEQQLAEGILNAIIEKLKQPVDEKRRAEVDAKLPTSVEVRPVPAVASEDVPNASIETVLADGVDEVDGASSAALEAFDTELIERTKAVFSNEALFRTKPVTDSSIAGLQALGTIRVLFNHYERALAKLRATSGATDMERVAEQLNRAYDRIMDEVERVNAAVLTKNVEHNDATVAGNDATVPENIATSESIPDPLILNEQYRVAETANEPLILNEQYLVVEPVPLLEPVTEAVAAPDQSSVEVADARESGEVIPFRRIENLYTKEREQLEGRVDELLARTELPENVEGLLRMAKTEMLTRLRLLKPSDAQYIPLRDNLKTLIGQAEMLLGESVSFVTPTLGGATIETGEAANEPTMPAIEGGANHYLAPLSPERQQRLRQNVGFRAALVIAFLAAVAPNKLSESQYSDTKASLPTAASLTGIGIDASWGSAGESGVTKLKVKEIVDDEQAEVAKITVMPPLPEVMENSVGEPAAPTMPEVVAEIPEPAVVLPELVSSVGEQAAPEVALPNTDTLPVALTAVPTVAETLPDRFVGVVKYGQLETYPDNQLNKFFAAIDTKNLPTELVERLRAKAKAGFYSDADALMTAGFSSNDANVVFDGEKLNYEQPVEQYKAEVAKALELLAAPHTEVVESGSNLTNTILTSYASDLTVVPAADRAGLVAKALTAYEAKTPEAVTLLGISDTEDIQSGTIVDLRPLAPYLSSAVADYVREQSAAASEGAAGGEADREAPASPDAGQSPLELTPETYPGGELAFSRDYQTLLTSLGISTTSGSWFDAMFAPAAPSNKAILGETVGDLTKVLISTSPTERTAALTALGISEDTARRVYELIVTERAAGQRRPSFEDDTTIEALLRNYVLRTPSSTI